MASVSTGPKLRQAAAIFHDASRVRDVFAELLQTGVADLDISFLTRRQAFERNFQPSFDRNLDNHLQRLSAGLIELGNTPIGAPLIGIPCSLASDQTKSGFEPPRGTSGTVRRWFQTSSSDVLFASLEAGGILLCAKLRGIDQERPITKIRLNHCADRELVQDLSGRRMRHGQVASGEPNRRPLVGSFRRFGLRWRK